MKAENYNSEKRSVCEKFIQQRQCIVEFFPPRIVVRFPSAQCNFAADFPPILELTGQLTDRRSDPQELRPSVAEALLSLDNFGPLHDTTVILGGTQDPFSGQFDVALKFLEHIALLRPKSLVIQTRSPLVLLTAPILSSLGNRAAVVIGIETASDNLARANDPHLPRPSERIEAARTLRSIGIPVAIQVAPFPEATRANEVELLVRSVTNACDEIILVPFRAVKQKRLSVNRIGTNGYQLETPANLDLTSEELAALERMIQAFEIADPNKPLYCFGASPSQGEERAAA